MIVSELIALLSKCDPNDKIMVARTQYNGSEDDLDYGDPLVFWDEDIIMLVPDKSLASNILSWELERYNYLIQVD